MLPAGRTYECLCADHVRLMGSSSKLQLLAFATRDLMPSAAGSKGRGGRSGSVTSGLIMLR